MRVNGRMRSFGTFDTSEEADRVLSAAASKLASPDYVAVGGTTLRELGERCLDRRELDGVRGIGTERSRFRIHIAPSWLGTMPVKAIAPRDVRQWVEEAVPAVMPAPAPTVSRSWSPAATTLARS
ncbi:MAG: hypothetical protein IPI67_30190 [Myxococcales bacterium]|nr:hypothetical protein [Myxococcales bacterium]